MENENLADFEQSFLKRIGIFIEWNWIPYISLKKRGSSSYSDRKFILSMQRYRNQRYKITNKVYVLRVYERYIYSLRVRTNVFGER